MRLSSYILMLAVAVSVPACRHHAPAIAHEGCFEACGHHFVPQGTGSHRLCSGEAAGELVGRVRATGVRVRLAPVRVGKYSRYELKLLAEGGANGSASLSARGAAQSAIVRKDGSITAMKDAPTTLPADWVALVSLDGNICMVAWNGKNGGSNPKFHAKNTSHGEAVYKVLEIDDPRYHHEGFPLREIRGQ